MAFEETATKVKTAVENNSYTVTDRAQRMLKKADYSNEQLENILRNPHKITLTESKGHKQEYTFMIEQMGVAFISIEDDKITVTGIVKLTAPETDHKKIKKYKKFNNDGYSWKPLVVLISVLLIIAIFIRFSK